MLPEISLERKFEERRSESSRKIIIDIEQMRALIEGIKSSERTVVLSGGTFDILHSDHIKWLESVKKLADILVVDVSTDARVKRFKGESRPLNPELERARVVAGLHCVDFVFINYSQYEGTTRLAMYLKPTIICQPEVRRASYGSADDLNKIQEILRDTQLVFLPEIRTPGVSSSEIIARIIARHQE